jgi:hypothetical protein
MGVTLRPIFVGTKNEHCSKHKNNTGEGAPQAPKDKMSAETPVKAATEEQTPRKCVEDLRKSQIFG